MWHHKIKNRTNPGLWWKLQDYLTCDSFFKNLKNDKIATASSIPLLSSMLTFFQQARHFSNCLPAMQDSAAHWGSLLCLFPSLFIIEAFFNSPDDFSILPFFCMPFFISVLFCRGFLVSYLLYFGLLLPLWLHGENLLTPAPVDCLQSHFFGFVGSKDTNLLFGSSHVRHSN